MRRFFGYLQIMEDAEIISLLLVKLVTHTHYQAIFLKQIINHSKTFRSGTLQKVNNTSVVAFGLNKVKTLCERGRD